MAEKKHSAKPLKILERMGKELLTEYLEKVVKSDVLKLEEDEKEKFNNADHEDKRQVFVDTIKEKQSKVGQMLLQTFFNVGENTNHDQVDPEKEERPEAPEESGGILKLCPPEEFMRLCREKSNEIYRIKEREGRTRMALIICNTEFKHLHFRQGAIFDIIGMKGLLEDLGYTVVVKENLTAEGMASELKDFAALPEHVTSDSTFLVFMSHGTLQGIYGTMHSKESADVLHYDTIYQIFNNCNCAGLRDKPKVIIVQACRGVNRGETWLRKNSDAPAFSPTELLRSVEADAVELSHVEKDFIAFYSTTPHNLSYRDEEGSYFIIKLIACFQKYACSCHLLDIFQKRIHERDPVKKLQDFAKSMLVGICDELVEKNVVNGEEFQRIGQDVHYTLSNTKNIFKKAEVAGRILADHIGNSKKQLDLKSEDESKVEEQALSVQTSAFSMTESRKEKEDEENKENPGVAHLSAAMLTVSKLIRYYQDTLREDRIINKGPSKIPISQ